jgi:hypothetical protein
MIGGESPRPLAEGSGAKGSSQKSILKALWYTPFTTTHVQFVIFEILN